MRKKLNLLNLTLVLAMIFSAALSVLAEDEGIPSPSVFLKKEIGTDGVLADYSEIESYFKEVARLSGRVSVVDLGKSSNDNNIIAGIITSEKNHKNLDKLIRLQAEITWNPAREKENWRDNRLFLLINCSMHSTEIGASQMSMKLLHEMASSKDEYTRQALDRLVIILLPSSNPDGINWVSRWYNKYLGTEFEGTRYPYLYQEYSGHDNNRDWYMLNLKESVVLNRWMSKVWYPQVVWDAHQMGGTGWRAIIPPFVGPPNPFIHPLVLTGVENAGHAMKYQMVADGRGGVAHSQTFSIWWNGGFRNTPYFKNSIGLLSELASAKLASRIDVTKEALESGRRNVNYLTRSVKNPLPWQGGSWGLPEIIAYEQSAARGLIKYASRNYREIIANYRQMSLDAMKGAPEAPGGYIVPVKQHDPGAAERMIDILTQHNIRVKQLDQELEYRGVKYNKGAVVIAGNQPFRPMIRSLLEKLNYPIETDEGSNPYDVNASTLPEMMGVTIEAMPSDYFEEFLAAAKLKDFSPESEKGVSTSSGNTFYLAGDSSSYKKVNEIISLGGFIKREKVGDQDHFVAYDPSRDARAMDITPEIEEARKSSLRHSKVALLRGNLNSISEGWTRWLLEEFRFPFASLDEKRVKEGSLINDFDTVILPSIREARLLQSSRAEVPQGYEAGIGRIGLQALEKFVLDGGTLVCLAESCRPVIKHFELPVGDALRGVDRNEFVIHGSLIKLDVNGKHPLAFGMPPQAAVMFYSALAFNIPEGDDRVKVVARYARHDTLLAGYAKGTDYIAGLVAMAEVKHGEGKVVLIGFPCQFRGQSWSTFKLLFNTLYQRGGEEKKLELKLENTEG